MHHEYQTFEMERENAVDAENSFRGKVEALRLFWKGMANVPHLEKVVRGYWSAPVSSSKSESTFSYTGDLITKKRSRLGGGLSEAITVVFDMTRQPTYQFSHVMDGLCSLQKEYERVKQSKRAARE
jgi:hypothetical protein